jgi:hypothetical protein
VLKWHKQCGAEYEFPHFQECVATKGGKDGVLGGELSEIDSDWVRCSFVWYTNIHSRGCYWMLFDAIECTQLLGLKPGRTPHCHV